MSLPTEDLRHARLFASRLVVVHARFSPFCGSVVVGLTMHWGFVYE